MQCGWRGGKPYEELGRWFPLHSGWTWLGPCLADGGSYHVALFLIFAHQHSQSRVWWKEITGFKVHREREWVCSGSGNERRQTEGIEMSLIQQVQPSDWACVLISVTVLAQGWGTGRCLPGAGGLCCSSLPIFSGLAISHQVPSGDRHLAGLCSIPGAARPPANLLCRISHWRVWTWSQKCSFQPWTAPIA